MPVYIVLTCDNCNKSFKRLKSLDKERKKIGVTTTYCSRACSSRHYSKNHNMEVKCQKCNKVFFVAISRKKRTKKFYCSGCFGSKTSLVCKTCSKPYDVYDSVIEFNSGSSYCSRECFGIGNRKPWNTVKRSNLKSRWLLEFGEKSLVCTRCGHDKPYNIHLHHKMYVKNGGITDPSNLEPLCRNCHGTEHYENGEDLDFGEKQHYKKL